MRKLLLVVLIFFGMIGVCLAQEPEQSFEGFNMQGYNDDGSKAWDVTGDTADIEGTEVVLSNVDANAYGEQAMNVTAETGKFDQIGGKMYLEKDVVITREDGSTMMTESLDWNREEDLVQTEDKIVLTDDMMTVTGTGMRAQPGLKTAKVNKDVMVTVDTEPDRTDDQKVTITSNGPMIIDQEKSMATFEDNVVAIQGLRTLKADRMEVYFTANMDGIREMICLGNVEITQGENQTYAEKAVYKASEQRLVLSGRPKLILITEGDNAITSLGE